jgi:CheY-like chemotaxis protein
LKPEVAFVEIGMPDLNGIEATGQILKRAVRRPPIIMMARTTRFR